jgi:hypothetical protein
MVEPFLQREEIDREVQRDTVSSQILLQGTKKQSSTPPDISRDTRASSLKVIIELTLVGMLKLSIPLLLNPK